VATYGTFVDNVTLKADEANDFFKTVSSTVTASQGVDLTIGNIVSRYYKVNKIIIWVFNCTIATAGTASNNLIVGLPVTASSGSFRCVGFARYFDSSAGQVYVLTPVKTSTTQIQFYADSGNSLTNRFGISPAVTAASPDSIAGWIMYEAA
jgi:hypothetical protein